MDNKKGFTYGAAGVNLKLGDDASKIMYNASVITYKNREGKVGEIQEYGDSFFSVRGITIKGLKPDAIISGGSDGIGTKVEFGERTGNHRDMAYNLIAMIADDAARFGAEPIYSKNELQVNELNDKNIEIVRQLALGLIDACAAAGIANLGGEVAELGRRVGGYGPFNYNWGGDITWVADPKRLITGQSIKEGMAVIAFLENAFRSNGISAVRKILEHYKGPEWHNEKYKEGMTWGGAVLTPSIIYTKVLVDMFGGYNGEEKVKLRGVAHITGGGIPGKLGRLLKPSKLGAYLDNLFDPCDMMLQLQAVDMPNKGPMGDKAAYESWNMGNGCLVIVDSEQQEGVIEIAKQHCLEARIAGKITNSGKIELISKGLYNGGKVLNDFS